MNNPISRSIQTIKSGMQPKDILAIILRRKFIIIFSLLSVLISTIFYVYKIEDIYESYSTLVLEDRATVIDQTYKISSRSLSFYEGILNSRTFIEMVLDSIGLDIFKNIFPKYTRNEALEYLKSAISLRKTTYTSFMRLNSIAKTRELAYFIASTATDLFQKRCQEVESEESRRTVVEIEKQLTLIRKNLEQAEHDYRSYKDKSGNILEGITPELKTLQDAYANDLAQVGVKEANLNAEKKQLAKLESILTPDDSQNTPEIQKLRSKLKELEKEKLRLENLGIRVSGLSTIDREIQEIEKQLLQYKQSSTRQTTDPNVIRQWQELRMSVLNKESELELFKRRLVSYKKSISNYKKDNPDILSQSLELLRLKRSKEVYENLYNILLEKAEEERIKGASHGAGLKIVDIARMPDKPIPKNETRYYILGVILGLILGFGLAFYIEFNDTSVKSTDDIERLLGIPVLGTIPHILHKKKDNIEIKRKSSSSKRATSVTQYPRHLLNFSGDESITTESYRSLRTNLSFVSPDKPLRCIILSSAGPSEGKSLTISNLALAYAQMGKKTLLIDTDLRRPVLHHLFNTKREPGFTNLFTENADYESVIRPTEKENLYLITAGIFTPNPAELVGSQKMSTHLEYFKNNFDVVFFDTPPIVAVTDACLLGTKVDGILIVIRSHKTDRELASRAINSLSKLGVKIIGSVLNDINLSHKYSSYGYYKYYYHYYKSNIE